MSKFVELPVDEYDKEAFAKFDPATAQFTIDNARALMWLSQLAYETKQPATIDAAKGFWSFAGITPIIRHKIGIPASFDTRGLIAERQGAVILAFAGTDPAVWETLATDFNVRPLDDKDTHFGFQAALEAAEGDIRQAIDLSKLTDRPLFVTGHSLGGALAGLAADFADKQGARPRAVYVFGMPRTGGQKFRDRYNATLGPVTYRLVHGLDIVPRVPPAKLRFRHVGRVLQCDSGAKFDASQLSAVGSDAPQLSQVFPALFFSRMRRLLQGDFLSPEGPGPIGPFFRFLPQSIRDHLPDQYYRALSP
jgi:triacylglycerol lipase